MTGFGFDGCVPGLAGASFQGFGAGTGTGFKIGKSSGTYGSGNSKGTGDTKA